MDQPPAGLGRGHQPDLVLGATRGPEMEAGPGKDDEQQREQQQASGAQPPPPAAHLRLPSGRLVGSVVAAQPAVDVGVGEGRCPYTVQAWMARAIPQSRAR
jgi:hypothetical protein